MPALLAHFLQGIVIGLAVAIPVGPIALLILRRALVEGRLAAFVSGLGAAFADTLFGAIAVIGLSAVTGLISAHHDVVQLIGGLFMLVIGVHIWRSAPTAELAHRPIHERNLATAFISTCLLTMANPMTLLGITGVIAAAGVGREPGELLRTTTAVVTGIFAGSAGWWLLVSTCAHWVGRKLSPLMQRRLNHLAALLLFAFGLYQLTDLALRSHARW